MIEKMQEILSKDEGGTPVFNTYAVEIGGALCEAIYNYIFNEYGMDENYDLIYTLDGVYEDGDQKFAILRNRKDLTYYRLNFSLTEENGFVPSQELTQVSPDFTPTENSQFAQDIAAYEVTYMESKKEKPEDPEPEAVPEEVEEPAPEVEPETEAEPVPDEDEKNKYNLDEVVEYQELLEKYSTLEGKVAELNESIANFNAQIETLNGTIETLTNENNALTQFKAKIEREEKQKLIDSFYMLSDE
jgi:uncharacterized phage infection (PIP) family protein YhgE